jgi:hypothetical protein
MLNETYDAIEEVLSSLDVGGEQSRQFAAEIKMLKDVLGYPRPIEDLEEELQRREMIVRKLRRLAVEAQGLKASLPTLPVAKWFDGTFHDATVDVYFQEHDLSQLLQFLADVGVSEES